MAGPKGFGTLLGAVIGGYAGFKFKKPVVGVLAGALAGSIITARQVQGPSAGMRMGWGKRQYPWEGYGYVTPASMFQNEAYALNPWEEAQLANSVDVLTDSLSRAVPRSVTGMRIYGVNAIKTAAKEVGGTTGDGSFGGREFAAFLDTIPRPPAQGTLTPAQSQYPRGGESAQAAAPFFAMLKNSLLAKGATKTAAAVTASARNYYYNVELPAGRRGSSSSSRPSSSSSSRPSSSSSSRPSSSTGISTTLSAGSLQRLTGDSPGGIGAWWGSQTPMKKALYLTLGIGTLGGLGYFAFKPRREMA